MKRKHTTQRDVTVRIEFDDNALTVGVALTALSPLVPLDSGAFGIPDATLRYTVTNKEHRSVPVTVVVSMSASLAITGHRFFAFLEFLGSPNVKNREEHGLRGLAFDTALRR